MVNSPTEVNKIWEKHKGSSSEVSWMVQKYISRFTALQHFSHSPVKFFLAVRFPCGLNTAVFDNKCWLPIGGPCTHLLCLPGIITIYNWAAKPVSYFLLIIWFLTFAQWHTSASPSPAPCSSAVVQTFLLFLQANRATYNSSSQQKNIFNSKLRYLLYEWNNSSLAIITY